MFPIIFVTMSFPPDKKTTGSFRWKMKNYFVAVISVEAYVIYTGDGSDEYDRFWMATHRQTLSFSVKACRNAMIALSQTFGDAQNSTYEVSKIYFKHCSNFQILM